MKLWKNKLFWRFLIPSLVGIFLFVTPVQYEGNISIPIAVAAGIFQNLLGEYAATVIWAIISASALVTVLHKIVRIPFIKHNPKLDGLFDVKGIWLVIRMLAFVLVNMIHFGIGPDFIIGELTGGFVMTSLLPTLLAVFLLASLLLSLLIDYGLLDFLARC